MKWTYLFLAIAAAAFAVLAAMQTDAALPRRSEGIRICITACVVNGAIFGVMHWLQRRTKATKTDAERA